MKDIDSSNHYPPGAATLSIHFLLVYPFIDHKKAFSLQLTEYIIGLKKFQVAIDYYFERPWMMLYIENCWFFFNGKGMYER